MAGVLLLCFCCFLFGDKQYPLWILLRIFHLPDASQFVCNRSDLVLWCRSSDTVLFQQDFDREQLLVALVLAAVESIYRDLLYGIRLLLGSTLQRASNRRKQRLHSHHQLSSSHLWPAACQTSIELQSSNFFSACWSLLFGFHGVVSTFWWVGQVSCLVILFHTQIISSCIFSRNGKNFVYTASDWKHQPFRALLFFFFLATFSIILHFTINYVHAIRAKLHSKLKLKESSAEKVDVRLEEV